MSVRELIIGSRGSDLALWQSRWVASQLKAPTRIEIIHTQGDKILDRDLSSAEGKGFFTKELEDALLARTIDLAVHSLKDLPTEQPPGLTIAAVTERAPVADLLLVHPDWYDASLPFPVKAGGKVGASSLRRQAYVRAASKVVEPTSLRGNVPTRVRKCREGQYAAVVLAEAGLSRLALDLKSLHAFRLNPELWLPAPGQGALGLESRKDDDAESAVRILHHDPTARSCAAERGLLARFEGGCHLPLGTHATISDGAIRLRALFAPTPDQLVRCDVTGSGVEEVVEKAFKTLNAAAARGERATIDGGKLCEPYVASS